LGRKRGALLALVCLVLVWPAAALAGNGGLAPPDSSTESGDTIRFIYWVVTAACAVVFLLIETALIFFIIRFRRRRDTAEDVEGPQIHGNTRLEILWTAIPALALAALAIFTIVKTPDVLANASGQAASDATEIRVEGHQFYWQYTYPNGAISFDTLYLPVGKTASLELHSKDVNHSWWVPELTGKLDAIPGHPNTLDFEPRRTGTYENGKCAEFCGIQHAIMDTTVRVVSEGEYRAWLEDNAPSDSEDALVALGEQEWTASCAKCHGLDGSGDIGPSIQGNGTLLNRSGLKRLLLNGQNEATIDSYMPPVGAGWQERQFDALIAYVKSNQRLSTSPAQGGQSGG
jgi:cytochrome c oxidase subunit II